MIKKLTPIWALLFACNCLAQNREIVFTRTTKNDGLSATRLNDIIRDHQGYYWFSSINGLQRYDGHRMVHFLNVPRDTNSLPDNNVTGLMEDKSHRLWLNAGGTICIYQPLSRNFKKIPAEGNRKFDSDHTPFYQDSHNTIWISNREHGLYYYDSLAKIIRPYNKKWPAYFNKIFGLAEVANTGHYWLSTEKGMLLYDPIKKTYYSATNNPLGLRCFKDSIFSQTKSVLYLDHRNVLWTLGWMSSRGFAPYRYELNKDELRLVENTELLRGFFTDKSGTTWAYGEIFSTYDYNLNRFVAIRKKRNNLYGIDLK